MKTKSFAMLAISSLLIASFAYVAPAMADEANGGMPMEQMLADNTGASSSMQIPSDSNSASQTLADNSSTDNTGSMSNSNADSNNHANSSNDANSNSSTSDSSNDQGTPDTATGDDDY